MEAPNGPSWRRRSRVLARAALAGAVLSLATVLAMAISTVEAGASSSSSVLRQLQKAASASAKAGSAHMTMTESVSASGQGNTRLVTAEGTVDFSPTATDLTMQVPVTGKNSPIQVIEVGATEYIRSEHTLGPLQAGRWYSESEQQAGANSGIQIGPSGLPGSNPSQLLTLLAAEGANVKRIGPRVVRGTPTTEYEADINFQKALAHAKSSHGPTLTPQGLQILHSLIGGSQLPMTIWVDDHSLVRQLRLTFPLSAGALAGLGASAGGSARLTIGMDMTHYGRRITIRRPSSSSPVPTNVIPPQ